MPMRDHTDLPSSGAISWNQMHIEAGGTSGTQVSINDRDLRNLTGVKKSNGAQSSASDFHGAYRDGHKHGDWCGAYVVGIHPDNSFTSSNYGSNNAASNAFLLFGSTSSGHGSASATQSPTSSLSNFSGNRDGRGCRRYASGAGYTDSGTIGGGYKSNSTSVIQYHKALDADDDGEGDIYWDVSIVAIAPGGYCTFGPTTGSLTGSYSLAKVILHDSDTEDSYGWPRRDQDNNPAAGPGNISGTGGFGGSIWNTIGWWNIGGYNSGYDAGSDTTDLFTVNA